MADNWKLIMQLCTIADAEGGGTAWQETQLRDGIPYTRTIRQAEAMSAAAQLLNAISAGRRPTKAQLDRARLIVRLAHWHKAGMKGELPFTGEE